ncbi:7-carboxy-7-deazaguanine synthase QueE [Paenibacillus tarimensis]
MGEMEQGDRQTMKERRIPVLELFGPTVQGEGMVIGRKTLFVRTAGCDYSCAWCDSAFTWDGSAKDEVQWMDAFEIVDRLAELGGSSFGHVTLSGGNPALIEALGGLIGLLHDRGVEVAVETQGSKFQEWLLQVDQLTLSPKPPSSGMKTDWAVLDKVAAEVTGQRSSGISLKVVVFDEKDLDYALAVHRRYPSIPFYVQAGNDELSEQDPAVLRDRLVSRYEWLVEQVMSNDELRQVHVLPQLHAWLWGNKRGV